MNHANRIGATAFAAVGPVGPLAWLVTLDSLARLLLDLLGRELVWREYSHAILSGVTVAGPTGSGK
jgi:hypothetical protein